MVFFFDTAHFNLKNKIIKQLMFSHFINPIIFKITTNQKAVSLGRETAFTFLTCKPKLVLGL